MADAPVPAFTADFTVFDYVRAVYPDLAVSEFGTHYPDEFFPDGQRIERTYRVWPPPGCECNCTACMSPLRGDLACFIEDREGHLKYFTGILRRLRYSFEHTVPRVVTPDPLPPEYLRSVDYWWTLRDRVWHELVVHVNVEAARRRARALPLLFLIRHHPVTEHMHAEPVYRGVIQFL